MFDINCKLIINALNSPHSYEPDSPRNELNAKLCEGNCDICGFRIRKKKGNNKQ